MVDRNLIICVQLVDYARAYDSLYVEDVYNVVEDILKLDPSNDIGVIQKGMGHAPKSYNISINSEEIWDTHQLSNFLEKKYRLTSGKVVLIQLYAQAFGKYENVMVKNAPPHWDKSYIERIVGAYGTIISITQEVLKYSVRQVKYGYDNIWNGNWRITMKVNKPIPSSLNISNERIEFHYRGQTKTCWRCGLGH